MWSPLIDAAAIAAHLSRTCGMLPLDIGDVDGAEASLRETLSHYEKLQFTAGVAAVALDLSGLLWHLWSAKTPGGSSSNQFNHVTSLVISRAAVSFSRFGIAKRFRPDRVLAKLQPCRRKTFGFPYPSVPCNSSSPSRIAQREA
jgi:hypothetical protein